MKIRSIWPCLSLWLLAATPGYGQPAPTPTPTPLSPAAGSEPAGPAPVVAAPATPTPVAAAPALTPPSPASAAPAEPLSASGTSAPVVSAPTSPAFDAIGATPTTIAHPTSLQSMGAALLTYVDKSGRVNVGVALEAAPLWLLLGESVTLRAWRESYAARAMSRFNVSFASAANSTGLTNVSQGLRFVFWDDTDPRWDKELEACLASALSAGLPNRQGGALPKDPDADDNSAAVVVDDAAVKACQTQARARANRNAVHASSGAVSSAVTEQQDTAGKASFGKFFAWLSLSQNFGSGSRWLSLLGSLRYVYQHPGDELDVGVRLRLGNNELGISVDGAWTPKIIDQELRAKAGVLALNGELRLMNTLWLSASAGGNFGADSGAAPDLFSVLHFKFATESAPSIAH